MSTNTNNNASQTLFRFVSLRNPKLAETSQENPGFIFKPEKRGIYGFFDQVINGWEPAQKISKIKAMEIAAINFIESRELKTEKDIDGSRYRSLRHLGKTLAKKEQVSESIYSEAETEWNSITATENEFEMRKTLWDHFIYQTVTQKDFYVKEALSQIIKAIHAIDLNALNAETASGRSPLEIAAEAVIVLPAVLFMDSVSLEDNGVPETTNPEREFSAMETNKLDAVAAREVQISSLALKAKSLENLKNDLSLLQLDFREEYQNIYTAAYAAYTDQIQPFLDAYRQKMEDVESNFTPQTTEEEKERAYESVPQPDLPPFEIDVKEIDILLLKSKLSEDAFETLAQLISLEERDPQEAERKYSTYQKILEKIEDGTSSMYAKMLSLSKIDGQKYAMVGGAAVPVQNRQNIAPFAYYLKPYLKQDLSGKQSFIQFGFFVEDETWGVSSAEISAVIAEGVINEKLSDIKVSGDMVSLPAMLVNRFQDITSLKIEIWFENGTSGVLEITDPQINTSNVGILRVETQNPNGIIIQIPNSFQPKQFGIKRLGIADYLKVEQSVHAYVPGEVSNIENVMASELRHKSSTARDYNEVTETTGKTQETEKLSDTTKTSRTDMQTEVAREISKQQNYEAHTRFGTSGTWYFEMGGSFAGNNSQNESNRQAVAQSREITERALERVLTKISEERVQKIIKEYTETNVHEFDNRGKVTTTTNPSEAKPQHITGVYRWIDKKMKNQIYNYGKRTMFEFMVPEPARLHDLATKSARNSFDEPIDPRKAPLPHTMPNGDVDEALIRYWAEQYHVKLDTLPANSKNIYFDKIWEKVDGNEEVRHRKLDIPENYAAKSVKVYYGFERNSPFYFLHNNGQIIFGGSMLSISDFAGSTIPLLNTTNSVDSNITIPANFTESYDFTYQCFNIDSVNIAFNIECRLSDAFMDSWRQKSFDDIITAYTKAKEKFDADMAAANQAAAEQEKENKEKKANFYRSTEANILKHNCIAYLLQSYAALGQTMSYDDGQQMQSFKMLFGDNLDNYTALAKFMEQAFEWQIMDYTFYPYYWASKAHWQNLYLAEDMDPLFRSFLQAGMARIIVTVKPGFENAVQFFMTTGKIWNGGEVPVIGDPLYLSIVDELRQPTGEPQGKFWISRVPTTLTILQDKSTGLSVTQPLPIFPEDEPENCENPLELETETSFEPRDIIMIGRDEKTTTLPNNIIKPI